MAVSFSSSFLSSTSIRLQCRLITSSVKREWLTHCVPSVIIIILVVVVVAFVVLAASVDC